MELPRSVELRRQKEIIEQWLNTLGVPEDAHAKLLEMLDEVEEEMNDLATAQKWVEYGRRPTT